MAAGRRSPSGGPSTPGSSSGSAPQVTRFAAGDRVFGYAEGRFGAHAELVAVAESSFVAPVPDGVDLHHAAAATEGSHYALSSIRRAGVEPGDRVLVHGATGAIGSAAVQLLADLGVDVIATAPTAHVELVRGLGARRVVDFEAEDFTAHRRDRRRRARPGRQEHLRGLPRDPARPDGVYVSSDLGPFAQNVALPLVTKLGRGRRVVFPFPMTTPEVLEHLRSRLESRAFRPCSTPRPTRSRTSSRPTATSRPARSSATSSSPSPMTIRYRIPDPRASEWVLEVVAATI